MIRVRGLSKAFGANRVLDAIDLHVAQGESLVVIGGSGTGKSVLLKCILGLIAPDAGQIEAGGHDMRSKRGREAFLREFGMLFQGGALFDSLPIWRNVAFRLLRGADRRGRAAAREIALDRLARVGLEPDVADRFPAELSGGMQKRAALARAIATDPKVIFFDEPTSGLDPIMSGVINRLIRDLVTEMGATAISITHDMRTVRDVGDRVAMLHGGKIRWIGPVNEMDASDDPYLAQFINGLSDGPIATVR